MGICGKIKRTSSLSEWCRPADCGTSLDGDNDKAIQLGGHTGGNLAVFIGGGSGWAVWQHTKSALRWYNVDLRWRRCDSLRAQSRLWCLCFFVVLHIGVVFRKEHYCECKSGDRYLAYKQAAPRCIGILSDPLDTPPVIGKR